MTAQASVEHLETNLTVWYRRY